MHTFQCSSRLITRAVTDSNTISLTFESVWI